MGPELMIPAGWGEGTLNQPLARPVVERRDVCVRRLRDAIANRYGVPPSALASLDPSTVAKMAARMQEERVIRVRIEHAPERPLHPGADGTFDGHASDIDHGP
jgi:hypothetical protein